MDEQPARLRDLARVFLKIGAMSYGGPAIMGIMQNEIQERRRWLGKERFVEGLSIVNMLPGPGATQLAIFIGHTKGGLAGGIVAGICFIIPAFAIMLLLASAYAAFGALPALRNAFYGIGPVVVGIFAVAIYRLAKGTIKDRLQIPIAVSAVGLVLFSPFGLAVILLAAGCAGVTLFHSWRTGLAALLILALAAAGAYAAEGFIVGSALPVAGPGPQSVAGPATLWDVSAFFFKVGTFTFGGGLSMLAFMQEQVVGQFGWLTPQEFVDGLALGQLTPGPILMLAAFIGYKLFGALGAAVAAGAIFLPSFVMVLSILPLLRRMKDLQWLKAFMRGVAPAVIGALGVSVVQMAPHAAPDIFTWCLLGGTIVISLFSKLGPLPLMAGGAAFGFLSLRRAWDFLR
ncbi:MAG: chromate transporter [Rhodospirillaceae bacterium]|jgi:chromate transporter|nr:chromate transporter [Rhodospirillaceae bacterium]